MKRETLLRKIREGKIEVVWGDAYTGRIVEVQYTATGARALVEIAD